MVVQVLVLLNLDTREMQPLLLFAPNSAATESSIQANSETMATLRTATAAQAHARSSLDIHDRARRQFASRAATANKEGTEQCDDGNKASGDGCSNT